MLLVQYSTVMKTVSKYYILNYYYSTLNLLVQECKPVSTAL